MMKRLLFIIILGFAPRLLLAYVYPGQGDVANFAQSAAIFARGGNIYVEQFHYNYSPLLGLPLVFVNTLPLPFGFAWRLFLSIISLINAALIARHSQRKALVFTLYWLNPAFIFFEGYRGQFEPLVVLPLLLALYHKRGGFWPGSVTLLMKHSSLFGVWTLFVYRVGTKRAIGWMVAGLAIFALSLALYLPDGLPNIINRVLLYKSWEGYGFGSSLLFWLVMPFTPFVAHWLKLDLPDALLFSLLSTLVFAYGANVDLFAMLIPFAYVKLERWGWYAAPLSVIAAVIVAPWSRLDVPEPNPANWLWIIAFAWFIQWILKHSKVEWESTKERRIEKRYGLDLDI